MFSEEGGDKITAYGVLADVHEQRQNGGVPVHWDGRYSERAIAEQALATYRAATCG